jgi:hypothetical protein
MNSRWNHKDYEFILTNDGSPTVKWLKGEKGFNGEPETMHHMGGAYSETQFLYGNIVRSCMDQEMMSFVSVGLGLGYIEILVGIEACVRGIRPENVKTLSFESDKFLRSEFLKWVKGEEDSDPVYRLIHSLFQKDSLVSMDQVRSWLLRQWELGQLSLSGALDSDWHWTQKFHCVLYDAFSAKTSPLLWEEEFLHNLIQSACEAKAVVSTYSSKGAMKRAMKNNGFKVTIRDGFHGRRNSTLGERL